VSREPTVSPLGCVLEGQQSTIHHHKRLPTAGSMMGWQYENHHTAADRRPHGS